MSSSYLTKKNLSSLLTHLKKGNKMITLNDFYAFYEGEYTKEFLSAMLGSRTFLSLISVFHN